MKYSAKFDVHPVVIVLLIALALIGLDLAWTRQRNIKRATAQPSKPQPSAAPFARRDPPPASEPITPMGKYTVERDDKPPSPFGLRRSSRPDTSERIAAMNEAVFSAATQGAAAYAERHQQRT